MFNIILHNLGLLAIHSFHARSSFPASVTKIMPPVLETERGSREYLAERKIKREAYLKERGGRKGDEEEAALPMSKAMVIYRVKIHLQ